MKHFTYIFLLAFTVLVVGCSDNELEFSENYDIPWKISTITATSITIIAPSFQTSEELDVVVLNLHNRKFVFEKKFVPIQE